MKRSFKQGGSATYLVEIRFNTMQARLVLDLRFMIFFVVIQVGEIGHGFVWLAYCRKGMIKPLILPFPVWRHVGQTLFDQHQFDLL